MDREANFAISLFANTSVTVFVIAFAVSATYMAYTRWANLMPSAKMGMLALNLVALFIIVRAGYWVPTMWLSDVQGTDRYHSFWIEYRWVSYIPASILGLAAMMALASAILRWSRLTLAVVLGVSVGFGLLVGGSWWASETGHWFDRQAVIEAHDAFVGHER